jgi:hypothetical protein
MTKQRNYVVGGGSKMTLRRDAAEPGTGIAAAQQVGGDQGFSWAPIFPASGSGCELFVFVE